MNPLTTLADGGLTQKALKGDRAAFEEVYRRHSPAIFRFALHMSGSRTVADEVTQDVFLALLRDKLAFDEKKGKLGAFLLGVARNKVRKYFRDEDPGDGLPVVETAALEPDVLEDLTRRESLERLRVAIASLPCAYREALVLCEIEEMNYEGAASVLGCPVGTVRSRLSRARALLAQKLRPELASRCVA